ncbi:MAG TPA: DUF1707 domain-containing protein [Gemmatimonadaceae bacterium]|nr:DUF1707 domain-containing protein [Gemmatimonadaceae bacterium]
MAVVREPLIDDSQIAIAGLYLFAMSELLRPGDSAAAVPVAQAARERVVELLTRHFAEDALSVEELESRLERAYRATTSAQLDALVADLPVPTPPDASTTAVAQVQRISGVLSGQEQRITGVVPRRLELRGRLGYVEMDLEEATFEPGITEIDVRAFMGYVQIRLPRGVRVDCGGKAFAGFFSLKGGAGGGAVESPRVVRVRGRAIFGFAECFVDSSE